MERADEGGLKVGYDTNRQIKRLLLLFSFMFIFFLEKLSLFTNVTNLLHFLLVNAHLMYRYWVCSLVVGL